MLFNKYIFLFNKIRVRLSSQSFFERRPNRTKDFCEVVGVWRMRGRDCEFMYTNQIQRFSLQILPFLNANSNINTLIGSNTNILLENCNAWLDYWEDSYFLVRKEIFSLVLIPVLGISFRLLLPVHHLKLHSSCHKGCLCVQQM